MLKIATLFVIVLVSLHTSESRIGYNVELERNLEAMWARVHSLKFELKDSAREIRSMTNLLPAMVQWYDQLTRSLSEELTEYFVKVEMEARRKQSLEHIHPEFILSTLILAQSRDIRLNLMNSVTMDERTKQLALEAVDETLEKVSVCFSNIMTEISEHPREWDRVEPRSSFDASSANALSGEMDDLVLETMRRMNRIVTNCKRDFRNVEAKFLRQAAQSVDQEAAEGTYVNYIA